MKKTLIAMTLFLIWLGTTIIALGFYLPFVVNSILTDNNFTIFGSNILMIVFISFIGILLLKLVYITFLVWRDFTVSHMV